MKSSGAVAQAENRPEMSLGNKLRYWGSLVGALGTLTAVAAGCGGGEQSGDGTAGEPVKPKGNTPEAADQPPPGWDTSYEYDGSGESAGEEEEDLDEIKAGVGEYDTPPHSVIVTGTGGDVDDLLADPSREYLKLGENIDLEGLEEECQELADERAEEMPHVYEGRPKNAILFFLEEDGEMAAYHCAEPGAMDYTEAK